MKVNCALLYIVLIPHRLSKIAMMNHITSCLARVLIPHRLSKIGIQRRIHAGCGRVLIPHRLSKIVEMEPMTPRLAMF